MTEDLLDETRVHRVTRPFSNHMADEGKTEQGEIADQIQNLVPNKLVRKPQAQFVQNPVVEKHDRIVEIAALTKPTSPQRFHFL